MPRNISGVYSLPPGVEAVDGELADASAYNLVLNDIRTDLNTIRPVGSGGTGASTLTAFADALGGVPSLNTRLGLLASSSNLSDLPSISTAQTNLGISPLGKSKIAGTVSTAFTAGGTSTQGLGPISATDQVVIVTSTPSIDGSVTVPAFVAGDVGKKIMIWNRGTLGIFVFPAVGMTLNSLAVDAPFFLPVGFVMEVHYVSATNALVSIKTNIDYPYEGTVSDEDDYGPWTYNWHPYDRNTRTGTETGIFYNSFATVANVVSPDFVDGYEYMFELRNVSGSAATQFQIELFRETDAVYGQALWITPSLTAATNHNVRIMLPTVRHGTRFAHLVESISAPNATGAPATTFIAATCYQNAQKRTRARFSFTTGSIDGFYGALYRRRNTW